MSHRHAVPMRAAVAAALTVLLGFAGVLPAGGVPGPDTSIVSVMGKGAAGAYLSDLSGRQVVLRGLNTQGSTKIAPDCMPEYGQAEIEREHREMGHNAVRLLIQWRCVEPEPWAFDSAYLDRLQALVKIYNDHGMTVLLDMHQDVYGPGVSSLAGVGNGAPRWATYTDGLPVPKQGQWWMYYITPGVTRAWDNFWNRFGNHPELSDHYAATWRFVAQRFANNPGVFGYDLMNEPYGGSALARELERGALSDLYIKTTASIREVDADTWIFLEPAALGANNGDPTGLRNIPDPRQGPPKIGYAPHLYPFGSEAGVTSALIPSLDLTLSLWRARVRDQARRLSPDGTTVPILVGEYGLDTRASGSITYLEHAHKVFGEMGASPFYYSSDRGDWGPYDTNGNPRNTRDLLASCWLPVVSGSVRAQTIQPGRCVADIDAVAGISQVYLPAATFPNGVQVSGASVVGWDPESRILKIQFAQSGPTTVTVTPGSTFR